MSKNKAAIALKRWIDQQRDDESQDDPWTVTAFAEQIGVTTASVYNWINGESLPGRDAARKLEQVTDGAVSHADW